MGRRNLKNEEFHAHKDYHNTVNNYIFGNLLFYTVLLKEFIVTFCEINTLNAKDIYFFDETLQFFFTYIEDRYRSDPSYLFLNGDIKFEHLRTLSLGPKKRGDSRDPVDKHMEDIGADYGDLYFINDEAVKMRIGRLLDKFNRYISTLATSTKNQKEAFTQEICTIRDMGFEIKAILDFTFEIGSNQNTTSMPTTSSAIFRPRGIKKTYSFSPKSDLSNPWMKPVGVHDFFILYWFFYLIAKMYDKYIIQKSNEELESEEYLPSLNIRSFSRKINVYRCLAVVFLVYSVYYLATKNNSSI